MNNQNGTGPPPAQQIGQVVEAETVQLAGTLAAAEIDSQIATAKRYPRATEKFLARCMNLATANSDIAASCYYTVPRAGKNIDGPSVRLAEIALGCWGNCICQGDVSHADRHYVYAVGMARDLETNIGVRVTVRRRITDKNGKRFNDDMIAVTANAAVSIALRNAIFKVVPAAYIHPVFNACKRVAAGTAETLPATRDRALAYLMACGVTQAQVLRAIRRSRIEDITMTDLETLRGYCSAIQNHEASPESIFGLVRQPEQTVMADSDSYAGSRTPQYSAADQTEAGQPIMTEMPQNAPQGQQGPPVTNLF